MHVCGPCNCSNRDNHLVLLRPKQLYILLTWIHRSSGLQHVHCKCQSAGALSCYWLVTDCQAATSTVHIVGQTSNTNHIAFLLFLAIDGTRYSCLPFLTSKICICAVTLSLRSHIFKNSSTKGHSSLVSPPRFTNSKAIFCMPFSGWQYLITRRTSFKFRPVQWSIMTDMKEASFRSASTCFIVHSATVCVLICLLFSDSVSVTDWREF